MPAWSIIFFSKLGFLRDVDPASFSLKCMPCFFRVKKCANLAFAAGLGEPGGDGGMSRFGIGGSVRSWINVRSAEKTCECSAGRSCGFCEPSCVGPRTGLSVFGTGISFDGVVSLAVSALVTC